MYSSAVYVQIITSVQNVPLAPPLTRTRIHRCVLVLHNDHLFRSYFVLCFTICDSAVDAGERRYCCQNLEKKGTRLAYLYKLLAFLMQKHQSLSSHSSGEKRNVRCLSIALYVSGLNVLRRADSSHSIGPSDEQTQNDNDVMLLIAFESSYRNQIWPAGESQVARA